MKYCIFSTFALFILVAVPPFMFAGIEFSPLSFFPKLDFSVPSNNFDSKSIDSEAAKRIFKQYGMLPLAFEAWPVIDGQARYFSHGQNYHILLTPRGAELALFHSAGDSSYQWHDLKNPNLIKPSAMTRDLLQMKLAGANIRSRAKGEDMLPGKSNYFIGNDPEKWLANVAQYSKVQFSEVYPGIDLVYYGNQGQLEYDIVVKPGADYKQVEWDIQGANKVEVSKAGELILMCKGGEIQFKKPVCYLLSESGIRKEVQGNYAVRLSGKVGFDVEVDSRGQTLVIDPILAYSTYLGGSGADWGFGVAVDGGGNAYVVGRTPGGFPTTAAAYQTIYAGGSYDVFVTKLNGNGSAILYSTYLGGSGADSGYGISVDSAGNAYITGSTAGGFPITAGAFQTLYGGAPVNAFVTEVSSGGNVLIYSSYLGGFNDAVGQGIALDNAGNAYVTGYAVGGFPTTAGAYQVAYAGGFWDGFVTKINSGGNAMLYSTYLGGVNIDYGMGIAVDNSGNAHVTGYTEGGFPTTIGAYQTAFGGGGLDAFVSKLDSNGTALLYSTYLGGNGIDGGLSIALDVGGNAYVTGWASSGFPTTIGAYQTAFGGASDAFVSKINVSGSALQYSTFVGGSGDDRGKSIAVDSTGNVYIAGHSSGFFPTTLGAYQGAYGGGSFDAIFAKLDSSGSSLQYSTYLGGSKYEEEYGMAVDNSGNAYVVGFTAGSFPTTAGAYSTIYGGGTYDAFVAKLEMVLPTMTPTQSVTITESMTMTVTPQSTPSDSPTESPTFTISPTPTVSVLPTISPTFTNSPTPSVTRTPLSDNFAGKLEIIGVYPHPVPATGAIIAVKLPMKGNMKIKIFTLKGQLVKSADMTFASAGSYEVSWNAKNDMGNDVAFGSYYLYVTLQGTNGSDLKAARWITVRR